MKSPHYSVYLFNKAWKQYDIKSVERYCDLQDVSSSLAQDIMYFSKEEGYSLFFISKVKKANHTNQENIDLLIETILHDIFSKGDYFYSKSNSDSLLQYLADNEIIITQKLPIKSIKTKNNEAVVMYPIYDINGVEKATLYVQMNKKNGTWTITKIRNIKTLLELLNEDKSTQFDLEINSSLEDIQEKPELFLIYWNSLLNQAKEHTSFTFRTTEKKFLNDVFETTSYLLYEKTEENDIHFKCAIDDSQGFSISVRDIYNVDDTIYYHGSAESGWIKVSEESATIEMIQTPFEYLQSWLFESSPSRVNVDIIEDVNKKTFDFDSGKTPNSEIPKTRISCFWEDSQIASIICEINSDGKLISGKIRKRKAKEILETVFTFLNINEPIVFSIDTKILGR